MERPIRFGAGICEEEDVDDTDYIENHNNETKNLWLEIASKLQKLHLKELAPTVTQASLSPAEKLNAIIDECLHQSDKLNKLQLELQELRRQYALVEKEKAEALKESVKEKNQRVALENLCRELEKRRKPENKGEDKQEKSLSEVLFGKDEVSERTALKKEIELLKEKLKDLKLQYDTREEHYVLEIKTKSLQLELAEARANQKMQMCSIEEDKTRTYADHLSHLLRTDKEQKEQLTMYTEKFDQFQETLTKSNEVFTKFKMEIEKMSTQISKLEKENAELKVKCDETDVSLISLLDEKMTLKKQLETERKQKQGLEGLCRTLQEQRNTTTEKPKPPATKGRK